MEETGKRIVSVGDSSVPVDYSLEGLAEGSQSVEITDDVREQHLKSLLLTEAEKTSSIKRQGIAEQVESIMQKDVKLREGAEWEAAEAVVKGSIGWDCEEQDKGFIPEEKETDEAILLSCCMEDVDSLSNPDDEYDSNSSASTNDSTKCVYSFCLRRTTEGGKKEEHLFARFKAYKAELDDAINALNTTFDKNRKKSLEAAKRDGRSDAKSGGENSNSCERGSGKGTKTPLCFTAFIPEPQEKSTPQKLEDDHGDSDSDDGFY